MASGYGLQGGPSRCFPFWQEVLACYVVNTSAEDDSGKKKCAPVLEDYYECLHHKKEVSIRADPSTIVIPALLAN
ncbi:NADH:ubiquinone oxidoreductase 11.5kD subunit [Hypoxylon rubiginosum]|uniref:NADH:ubiquinone oxidoreductase 11.5kD subunit n=1 Tax=Hypoxylon rubiginosum TaxID=110542 RepID=A0ACB9Z9V9_9PEZI|nr:NADH:ubiquinone oxidoreductase 11.5kD subunit [Hypoxylon rubiginosum]